MWGAGNGKRKGVLPLSADINVTSLVDVAFTLLVIFIITAPILQGGIEVQLPRAEAAPITQSDGVIVSITKDGTIYIGEVAVQSVEDFLTIYPQIMEQKKSGEAYLKADREVPYGEVMQVLGLMKSLDVAEVGLVIDPEPRR